jgi:hypothetical protein
MSDHFKSNNLGANSESEDAADRPTGRRDEAHANNLAAGHRLAPDAGDCRRLRPAPLVGVVGAPKSGLRAVGSQLSERDHAVVHSIAALRLMTARQIERLHFREGSPLTQARRSRHALERLHRMDLLHRLERRVGGIHAGSSSYIYSLSSRGRRLLDIGGPAGGRRRRPAEPSITFQDHALAISELCVRLHEAARQGDFELLVFEAEPRCWRPYAGLGGERVVLKPDAFVSVADNDFETLSFVEIDLGTEGRTAIHRKGQAYLDYALSGTEQDKQHIFPRVVFVVPNERRASFVRNALRPIRRSEELFVVGLERDSVGVISGGMS